MKVFLAIDIGATSGRHIAGYKEGGEIRLEEVYRFPNGAKSENGSLVWDTESLFAEIKTGLKKAFQKYGGIESAAVDTWGVDYVLLSGEREMFPCYAYRDGRTEAAVSEVHKLVPFGELYAKTGLMYASFNSIYQLYCDKKSGRLENATDFLMLPEYFSWKLTGVKAKEYTNATTTGLVNAFTHKFDGDIVGRLGLKKELFGGPLRNPGYVLGELREEVRREVGGNTKVMFCASHDTASAVHGIPMRENAPYISSGTWSLMGIKSEKAVLVSADLSNEGGVNNTFRYQKNIMGMWVVNKLKETLKTPMSFAEMDAAADVTTKRSTSTIRLFSRPTTCGRRSWPICGAAAYRCRPTKRGWCVRSTAASPSAMRKRSLCSKRIRAERTANSTSWAGARRTSRSTVLPKSSRKRK